MGAPKGRPKPAGAGRKKGTLNKANKSMQEKLDALGCDPIEGMARIAVDCETAFTDKLKALVEGGDIDIPGLYKDLNLAGQMYKELAQYVAPKRKAIEHTGADGGPIIQKLARIELVPLTDDDAKG